MTNKRLPLINMSLHAPIACLSVSLRKETGCEFPSNSVPNTIGPGGWGGDWYVWHAPDGLRAIAATGLGCVQAGAQKLGVIEASYASAIIGVQGRLRTDKRPLIQADLKLPDRPPRLRPGRLGRRLRLLPRARPGAPLRSYQRDSMSSGLGLRSSMTAFISSETMVTLKQW